MGPRISPAWSRGSTRCASMPPMAAPGPKPRSPPSSSDWGPDMPTPDKADAAEALLDRGLRNLWYPVAPSWQVRGDPVGITRLDERIVLWRDGDGQVHALAERCPHRGARLSLGWNLGNRLACWYHGVEVDATGTVVDVPAVDQCPLEGQTCVRSYPAKEIQGAIFLWFGDALHQAPAPL